MGGRPPRGAAAAGLLAAAQLAVWAQAGALARVLLGRAFSGGSCAGGGWRCFATDGSARAGGALFHDMAANMLGSFLMALLSENSAHALWWEGFMPVSLLPREHWLQGYGNLWLGLRVGLCGSLTTFSSWNSQMVRLAAAGHGTPYAAGSQVVPALLGYLVGTIVALGCYVLGEQAAQAVGLRHLVARAVRGEGGGGEGGPGEAAGPAELGAVELRGAGGSAPPPFPPDPCGGQGVPCAGGGCGGGGGGGAAPPPLLRSECAQREKLGLWDRVHKNRLVQHLGPWRAREECAGDSELHVVRASQGDLVVVHQRGEGKGEGGGSPGEPLVFRATGHVAMFSPQLVAAGGGAGGSALRAAPVPAHAPPLLGARGHAAEPRWAAACDALFLAAFCAASAGLAVALALDPDGARAEVYLALLLAPAGACLRWQLCARLNGALPGRWHWFPAGTFLSNMAGSAVSALALALVVHLCPGGGGAGSPPRGSASYWAAASLGGVSVGFAGCLSTVSTFAGEVRKFMAMYPRNAHGWVYLASSFGSSFALGLALYGWAAWGPQADAWCAGGAPAP